MEDRETEIRERIRKMGQTAESASPIGSELFRRYEVKRGLRDLDGRGVLVGLTEIGEVHSYIVDEGEMIPVPGRLSYRGIDVREIVDGFMGEDRYGFEETIYLLLFGHLPDRAELENFREVLASCRSLPENFVSDVILKIPSRDVMNSMARSTLAMYALDPQAEDTSVPNVLEQCLRLIATFPVMAVYAYLTMAHYYQGKSLYIHAPRPELGVAENILALLRQDMEYTDLEAKLLDLALVLHAEHGGGNNSTFVTHVVTSSGSDTYSVVAAALGSLKGPRHGGANIKVVQMFDDLKEQVSDWEDEQAIADYLLRLLNREAFDRSGLIYGMGHAVYSISDPRTEVFRQYVGQLAAEKGLQKEYELYQRVEKLAPEVIASKRRIYKGVSANVDFYSGLVYRLLGIPQELYTPLFAVSRIVGWSAHRIEELVNAGKIIRPAYKSVARRQRYIPLDRRNPGQEEGK